MDKLLTSDPKLCGWKFNKKRLFSKENDIDGYNKREIFGIAKSLYDELIMRDGVKNEFHKFTLSKGTFKDKISTWMLRIDQFALTRLNHLDSMINILSQDIKRQSVTIIPLMIELFIQSSPKKYGKKTHDNNNNKNENKHRGLLPDRHLLSFNDRLEEIKNDKNICEICQMHLILWYFEHLLKIKYKSFIELLEFYSSNSSIEKLKYCSILGLWKLITNKPENESLILSLMINKFGENDKDYARKITEYLIKISTKHPMMKPDIISEINNYLIRPSLSPRGLYRAVFFLTKLRFTSLENEAATLLCGIYMDLFKQLMSYQTIFDILAEKSKSKNNNNKDKDNELFAHIFDNNNSNKSNKSILDKNNELLIMKKLVLMSNKKRGIYFKTHKRELSIWKRFLEFEQITPKLLTCILRGISYAFPFANLNLKIFKSDLDYIYKLILKSNMKIALMALKFTFRVESRKETNISGTDITDKTPRQLIKHSKNRIEQNIMRIVTPSDRFYQVLYSICSRWDFVIYPHPEILFHLLYQTIKCDIDKKRICSFVRRLIQFSSYGNVSWICGSLYLFSAILKIHPFLINMFESTPNQITNNSQQLLEKGNNTLYNLYQFQPKLSNCNLYPIWELTNLINHIHPAVRNFTKQLLINKNIKYNGDPLKDFQRKVLFEKFSRIMAHKMKEFKPKTRKLTNHDKQKLINSYLVGDEFIAIYKQHQGILNNKYNEKKMNYNSNDDDKDDDDDDNDDKIDLDEDNPNDVLLADQEMFKWLKSHFGSEIPDDTFDDDADYDYSELTKEIEKQKDQHQDQDQDEEVDIYVSDVDKDFDQDDDDNDNIHEISDGEQEEEEFDDDNDMMTEQQRVKLGNKMIFNQLENDDIILPNDVEYASNSEDDDDYNINTATISKNDEKFLQEDDQDQQQEQEEEEEGEDNIGDFFDEDGISAGQLKI